MTNANARHHLAILEAEGLVTVVGQRLAHGKGRPAYIYRPSGQLASHNFDRLCAALLEEISFSNPMGLQNEVLDRLASSIINNLKMKQVTGEPAIIERTATSTHLSQRLYWTISQINQMNYQARWEARADAPHIIFNHCPYKAILSHHPELCQLDTWLLEHVLGVAVEQVAKLAQDQRGLHLCIFRVRKA